MTFLTALEIAYNHKNGNISILSSQNKETKKYTSLMYLMKDGEIHKLMLSFDINDEFKGWNTEDEAIKAMEKVRDEAINFVEKEWDEQIKSK